MDAERLTVEVRESTSVTVLRSRPADAASGIAFVYAPGAGSNLDDPFGAHLSATLPAHGIELWRFQFPYMESGRKRPDQPALLTATWTAVLSRVRNEAPPIVVAGGRSMGGRIASMVVAAGAEVQGLALFAYPLIPPGRSASPRTEHLPKIRVPTLFCSGGRDAFATPDQLTEAAELVAHFTVQILEGADHGFSALKSSGRTRQDIWEEATGSLLAFLSTLEKER